MVGARHSQTRVPGLGGEFALTTEQTEKSVSASCDLPEAAGVFARPLGPWPLLVIALVALVVIAPFFFRGNPSGHDFEFHLNSWMEVNQQWRAGVFYPRWAEGANYGYGEPRFIFYPPLSWLMGAGLGLVLPWKVVPGAFIWLALVFAGGSMFLLARRWLSARDAVFAAALYAANPYSILIVYWRSAFAELLAAALLPLVLLLVLRLESDAPPRRRETAAALALVVAAAWLSDAPAGVMVNYSLVLLLLAAGFAWRSWRALAYGAFGLIAGMGLAAFYLLPAAYEQKWVDIFQAISPGVRPQDNFLFSQAPDVAHHQFNLLVSLVAAAQIIVLALTVFCWRRWRRRLPTAWWLLALWGGLCVLLMLPFSGFIWNTLPKLRFMQFPWRWLVGMNVVFALLATVSWRRWSARAVAAAVLLAALLFAGWRVLPPWWDSAADVAELQDNIVTGAGYEGTDEYLPKSADLDQTDHNPRHLTYAGSGNDQIHVLRWRAQKKIVLATVSAPGNLVLHLFNYPAWKVTVNGRVVAAQSRNGGGQMVIPVQAGENLVQVNFSRTWDRTAGGWVSLAALLALGGWVAVGRRRRPEEN